MLEKQLDSLLSTSHSKTNTKQPLEYLVKTGDMILHVEIIVDIIIKSDLKTNRQVQRNSCMF